MTIEFEIDSIPFQVTPDDEAAGANRARAIAAIEKIEAAQVAIEDDIAEATADLAILNGSPTNAQVLAAVINEVERSRRNMRRLSKVGDYLIAIIKFVIKFVKVG